MFVRQIAIRLRESTLNDVVVFSLLISDVNGRLVICGRDGEQEDQMRVEFVE